MPANNRRVPAVRLRRANEADAETLGLVMFDAIHATPSPYSEAQRHAWLDSPPAGPDWRARLARQTVIMAQDARGQAQGFMTLSEDGEIDLAFLRPVLRGTGAFRALLARIETEASASGLTALTSFASLSAQGPFAACGFALLRRETVRCAGQALPRALMHKTLASATGPGQTDPGF